MKSSLRHGISGFALLSLLASASAVRAGNITFFQFGSEPDPFGKTFEEFNYDSNGLTAGVGAGGDGVPFVAPGLLGAISGNLHGVDVSSHGYDSPPYHLLNDLSLSLEGFTPTDPATHSDENAATTQNLSGGDFSIFYNYNGTNIELLSGHTDSFLVTIKDTGSNGSTLSAEVEYTGGILYNQLTDAGLSHNGTFSIALSGIDGIDGANAIGTDGFLHSFSADGIGTFDAAPASPEGGAPVPTPAALWSGLGLLTLLGASRIKKRSSNPS